MSNIAQRNQAYVALGANLGDAQATLRLAIAALGELPDTRLLRASSLYASAAIGYENQPDFINAVALVDTALAPQDLLDALLSLEHDFGRERSFRNAPRLLDLDVLLYAEAIINSPKLHVPHPRMHERAFVLMPLAEISPDLQIPGLGSVNSLMQQLPPQRIRRIDANSMK